MSREGIHQIQWSRITFKLINSLTDFLLPLFISSIHFPCCHDARCSRTDLKSVCVRATVGAYRPVCASIPPAAFQPRSVGAFQAYFCCSCCVFFATSLLPPFPDTFHSAHVGVYVCVCVCVGFIRPPPQWTPVRWTAQQPGFWIWMCSI